MDFKKWLESTEPDYETAFLRQIQSNPQDMHNWSVFADWLEERGDDERAELIRKLVPLDRKIIGGRSRAGLRNLYTYYGGEFMRTLMMSFPVARCAVEWKMSLYDAALILHDVQIFNKHVSGSSQAILRKANRLMGGHGIGIVRGDRNFTTGYEDVAAQYVNTGDAYRLTVVLDIPRMKFYLTSIGDWVAENRDRYGI